MFSPESVILFTGGCLCPSMHHRSHTGGSLSEGSLSEEFLSGGVSVHDGLCLGESISKVISLREAPCTVMSGRINNVSNPTRMHSCLF